MHEYKIKVHARIERDMVSEIIKEYGTVKNFICHQIQTNEDALDLALIKTFLNDRIPDDEIRDIKMMLLFSGLTCGQIADYKGLKQHQVWRILHCQTYADVDIY